MNLKISATLGPFNLIGPNQFWLLPSQSLSVYPFSMQNQWVWLSCLSIIVGLSIYLGPRLGSSKRCKGESQVLESCYTLSNCCLCGALDTAKNTKPFRQIRHHRNCSHKLGQAFRRFVKKGKTANIYPFYERQRQIGREEKASIVVCWAHFSEFC